MFDIDALVACLTATSICARKGQPDHAAFVTGPLDTTQQQRHLVVDRVGAARWQADPIGGYQGRLPRPVCF